MIRSRLLAAGALFLAVGAAQAQTPTPTAPAGPMARTPMSPVSPASPTAPTPDASAQPATPAPTPAPSGSAFAAIVPAPGADLAGTLKASGQFSTLLKVADATGLTPVLARPGLTIFAPTDAAFAASGADVSDAGLKDADNLKKLQGVLTYHVVNAKIPDFKGRQASVTAANQQKVYLDGAGDMVKVNDATALQAAVSAGGSTIYPIDKVITPGFTPPTPPAAEAATDDKAAATTTKKTTTTTRKKR